MQAKITLSASPHNAILINGLDFHRIGVWATIMLSTGLDMLDIEVTYYTMYIEGINISDLMLN